MTEEVVEIHTDGACRYNPGPGGWGAVLQFNSGPKKISGGLRDTTNNRMELTAVIEALKALQPASRVRLYTDSTYVKQGITTWIHDWKRRKWRTADKKPVKNVDLWMMLDEVASQHEIEWHWVRGHAGNPGNEEADRLATEAIPDETDRP